MKETMKKKLTNMVVDTAIHTAAMPNQCCPFLFGEAKSKMNLTSADYMELVKHFKKS